MAWARLGILLIALAAAAPAAADTLAEPHAQGAVLVAPPTRFKCQDGGDILAKFETTRGRLVAVVDALDGYGPHMLAWKPYVDGPVMLTWSDGQRTLTWSPGVQIMWMDEGAHRMCGRAMSHSH